LLPRCYQTMPYQPDPRSTASVPKCYKIFELYMLVDLSRNTLGFTFTQRVQEMKGLASL
jgi:hypothetical protein